MKRTSLLGFVGLMASILAGCPIYSGDGNSGTQSSTSTNGCTSSAQCLANETCGSDGQCHSGDCTLWGCSEGFACQVDPTTGTASCQPNGSTGPGGAGGSGGSSTSSTSGTSSTTSGTGGSMPVYCGHPADCAAGETCAADGTCKPGDCTVNTCIFGFACQSDGTCKSTTPNACDGDADCASDGAGWTCIAGPKGGGVCTQPSDQCFDQSQCDAGDKCVSGKCIKACSTNTDCRDGYTCDTTHGVCTTPGKTCTITNDCGSADKVCVGGVCVPRSQGGNCGAGDVWADNGCVPNQAPTFTCVVEGMQDACATGSICLHHSCWISCDAPNQTVCNSQPPALNTCKPVMTSSMTYNVCGSSQNLGGECDPTTSKNCSGAGQVCIDGFCK